MESYYERNRDTIVEQKRKYYQENKEAIKAKSRAQYRANKTRHAETSARWRSENGEKTRQYRKNWESRNPEYYLINNARRRAKALGVPFELKRSDLFVPEVCPVLGIPLIRGKRKLTDNSPSLDRVIPSLGYTKDNVKVISLKANRWKNEMTIDDLKKIIDYLESHRS